MERDKQKKILKHFRDVGSSEFVRLRTWGGFFWEFLRTY